MNKKKVKELLLPFIVEERCSDKGEISQIDWKIQDSTTYSALFFFMGSQPKEATFFSQYKVGLLILNKKIENLSSDYIILKEEFFLQAQKILLDFFYPLPAHFKIVGITGSNGKTTTAHLAMQIATQWGYPAVVVGTLGVYSISQILRKESLTTPPLIELRKIFYEICSTYQVCFLEVSSHALEQERVFGLEFSQGAWTNFSQDHLDYHESMENYFLAKCKIFSYLAKDAKVFIPHEEVFLYQKLLGLFPSSIQQSEKLFCSKEDIPLFFKAKYNQANLDLAWSLNKQLWKEAKVVDLEKLNAPAGRFKINKIGEKLTIVDFAHTPDAIANICQGVKSSFPDFNIHIVFGCGGDRDKSKRALMGKVALQYASKVYVTSDNPRGEDPQEIIKEIVKGMLPEIDSGIVEVIVERKQALEKAFINLKSSDILLVLGKGHEDYQLIKGIKHPFNDELILKGLGKKYGFI